MICLAAIGLFGAVVVSEASGWTPIDYRKDIKKNSILDFSAIGRLDGPSGKKGWLKAVGRHFEFEKERGVPRRFYGVNLCFDANYPPDAGAGERLLERFARLGYNTIRIHHHDDYLSKPGMFERLDRFVASAIARGFYLSTDLFVSRRTDMDRQLYKSMVALSDSHYADFEDHARKFLEHVNPHTGRRYADEPAIAWISAVNEGEMTWCWDKLKSTPEFIAQYEAFKRKTGAENPPRESFAADVEDRFIVKVKAFLKRVGEKALLTNQNAGMYHAAMEAVRSRHYDYVDTHCYFDGAKWLGKKWFPPFAMRGENPLQCGWRHYANIAFMRLEDKPFTVSEWEFKGPGLYRGTSGLVMGSMAALQDWNGLWRFAYAHSWDITQEGVGTPTYLDLCTDPLTQASDRAAVCLFLRGDIAPLADEIHPLIDEAALDATRTDAACLLPSRWIDAAWKARIGVRVGAGEGPSVVGLASSKRCPVPLRDSPSVKPDRKAGTLTVSTSRTVGGFGRAGTVISEGPFAAGIEGTFASVWASSVDGRPLAQSSRILLCHLTDCQTEGNTYEDDTFRKMLAWGKGRTMIRDGSASVSLGLKDAKDYDVWAVATDGSRIAKIGSSVVDGRLTFTVSTRHGGEAVLYHEIARRSR